MNIKFKVAMAALHQNDDAFAAGLISSVTHGRMREAALAAALKNMAKTYGVTLKDTYINPRGCFHIIAAERFGARFADVLNTASPRRGAVPGAVLTEQAAWCFMDHCDVERLVLRFYAQESAKPSVRSRLARQMRAVFAPSVTAS